MQLLIHAGIKAMLVKGATGVSDVCDCIGRDIWYWYKPIGQWERSFQMKTV